MSEGIESGPPGKRPAPVGNSGRKLPAVRQSQHRRSLPSPGQNASPDQERHEIITNGFNHHKSVDDRNIDGGENGVSSVVDEDEIIPNKDTSSQLPQSPGKASVAYISEMLICKLGKKDNISEITALNLTLARDHMNKKIKYIENLDKLKKLQTLNLSNNIIEKIERLDKLTQLRELNLSNNLITKIEGLDSLTRLQVLNLSRNQIEHIPAGLFKKLRELRVIGLSHNQLEALVELTRLRPLADLVKLSVEGNPLTNPTHSRQFIIFQLRSLEVLDGKVVTEEDREAADVRFGQEEVRRLHDELDRQQKKYCELKGDNEKTLLEVQRLTNLHNEQKTKSERQIDKIKELRRELDSNADLLKRKNAELSKACEKQFKLEQELAFYKLDAKFEHLGKMPFPDGAEFVEDGRNDESPYIGKAGFKPNEFAWDTFIKSPGQRAQVSPGGFYQSERSDGRNRASQQQPGEAAIIELQDKEQAIREAEERLTALREEVFIMEQQLRDASDKLGRVQQAIKDQGKLLGDQENKLLDAIGAKMKYIRDLQKLAADLEDKMNQVGEDIRQQEDELERLRQDLSSTPSDDRAYDELLNCVAAREQQLKNVMDEFDLLKNEYDKVIDMLRQEMADVKRLEDELAELQSKAKQDQDKLKEELKDLVEELTCQLDKMKEQAKQQQQRIGQLQQEKDALARRVKDLQQQIGPANELKDRIAKLQQQLQGTQEALDQERKERDGLRQQLAHVAGNGERLEDTKERLHAAENEAEKLRKALDKLKKQQQADRHAADERIKKEQDKVERALQAARGVGDKERQARDLELQVDALKTANASLDDRLKDAENELRRKMKDSLDKDEVLRRLGDLKDDIDRGKVKVIPPVDEYDDLGRALASLQNRYNDITGALQRERQGSERERKANDSEIQALEERLVDADNALQTARDAAKEHERASKAKDDDLRQMADELRRLKDKLSKQRSLEDELDKERSAHAMAMRKLEAQLGQMKDHYQRTRAGLEEELANARAPLLEKIRGLEDTLRQLQQKLNKAMREADRLKGDKDAAEFGRGELEDQIADLLKALRETEDRAGDIEARLGREKRLLEERVADLEEELERAKELLRNLKEDAAMQIQKQRAKNDADLQCLEEELERMKDKMKNMQEKAAREAARNQQREARRAQELEGELSALMKDLQKRVDELGRVQDEAALLKDLLNDKESQLRAATQRERAQQARLRGIEEQMSELRHMQQDVGAQTLQDKLEKELENAKAWQRRSAAEEAATRELARAQEQIAALQSLLRDKDRQLQEAMHRGPNNSAQLAAQRDEIGNLAAALREQSAEIDRLKNMFGQQFSPRTTGLTRSARHDASLTALADEVVALRNALRDREQQVEELLQQNGFQWHPGIVSPSNPLGTGPNDIPANSGRVMARTVSGVQSMPASAAATPGSTAVPSAAGMCTTANEIHHHHHLSKKSPRSRGTKKSVKIRDQDIVLSPVSLASAAVTSSTPGHVHHHHYSVAPHGKENSRIKKEDDLYCNVPDHEDLEDEVEELERLLEATSPVGSHLKKNQRDRQSLRMELQDLEGEVEDALKRRSSIKRIQHQDLDATLAGTNGIAVSAVASGVNKTEKTSVVPEQYLEQSCGSAQISPKAALKRHHDTAPSFASTAPQGVTREYCTNHRDLAREHRLDEIQLMDAMLMEKKRELQGLEAVLANRKQELNQILFERKKGDDILRQTELDASAIEDRAVETSMELKRAGKHLTNMEMKIKMLQAKVDELDKIVAMKKAETAHVEDICRVTHQNLENINQNLKVKSKELQDKTNQLREVEERLEELREAVASTEKREKEKSDKYLTVLREGEKALEEKAAHLARTRNELQSQSVEYLNLSSRIARARVELRDLEETATERQRETEDIAKTREEEKLAHEEMLKEAREKLEELHEARNEVLTTLRKHREELKQIRNNNKELCTELSKCAEIKAQKENEIKEISLKLKEKLRKLFEVKENLKKSQQDFERLQTQCKDTQAKHKGFMKDLENLEQQNSEMEGKKKALDSSVSDLQNKENRLQTELLQKDKSVKEYLLQLEYLQKDLVVTRTETLNACTEKGKIEQQLTEKQAELKKLTEELQESREQVRREQEELDKLQEQKRENNEMNTMQARQVEGEQKATQTDSVENTDKNTERSTQLQIVSNQKTRKRLIPDISRLTKSSFKNSPVSFDENVGSQTPQSVMGVSSPRPAAIQGCDISELEQEANRLNVEKELITKALKKSLAELKQTKHTLNKEKEEAGRRVKKLLEETDVYRTELDKLRLEREKERMLATLELENLRQEAESERSKANRASHEIMVLREQFDKQKAKLISFEEKNVSFVKEEIETLASKLKKDVTKCLNEVQYSREQAVEDLHQLQEKKETMEVQLATLQDSINEATRDSLKAQMQKRESTKQKNEDSLKRLAKENIAQQQRFLKTQISQQMSRHANLYEDEKRKAEASLQGLKTKLANLEKIITRKDATLENARKELGTEKLERRKSLILEKEAEDLKRKLETVEQERDILVYERERLIGPNIHGCFIREPIAIYSAHSSNQTASDVWRNTKDKNHRSTSFARDENFDYFLSSRDNFPTRDLNSIIKKGRQSTSVHKLRKKNRDRSESMNSGKSFNQASFAREFTLDAKNEELNKSRQSISLSIASENDSDMPLKESVDVKDENFENTKSKLEETNTAQFSNYNGKRKENCALSSSREPSVSLNNSTTAEFRCSDGKVLASEKGQLTDEISTHPPQGMASSFAKETKLKFLALVNRLKEEKLRALETSTKGLIRNTKPL